jgi:hypothetical protein
MKWLGRLGAAFLLSAALFAGAPVAQAQQAQPGQLAPCPLTTTAKIITATSYRVTTADRCQFVTFTSASTITIELPAPSLLFQPGFEVRLVPTNGGTLTFTNLQDDAGTRHKINLGTTLTLTAGTGAELMILQDMNWWAALLGGASKGTVTSVDLSMPSGFTVTGGPITDGGTLAVSAASMSEHLFAAGPISGTSAWSWRAIDPSDLPATVGSCGSLSNAGTACQAATGSSGHTVGFLDGTNAFSGTNTFGGGNISLNSNGSFSVGNVSISQTGDLTAGNGGFTVNGSNGNVSAAGGALSINGSTGALTGAAASFGSGGFQVAGGGAITIGNVSMNSAATNVYTGSSSFAEVLFKVQTETTTARTLAAADCGTQIDFTNASTITVTIPNSMPIGCGISLRQGGTGQVQPAAGSGATLRTPHGFVGTSAQYAIIGLNIAENSGGAAAIADFVGDGQ